MKHLRSHLVYIVCVLGLLTLPLWALIIIFASDTEMYPTQPVDWRLLIFRGYWLPRLLFVGIVLICIPVYFEAIRKSLWYILGVLLQIGVMFGAFFVWLVIDANLYVRSEVDFEGKTYRLVQASPAANYRLDLYECEGWTCQGRTVVATDSSKIQDASLVVDGNTISIFYDEGYGSPQTIELDHEE